MSKIEITYDYNYPGLGLKEFGFSVDGKEYKVTAKKGNEQLLDNFFRFIHVAKKSGRSPFSYKKGDQTATQLFDIEPKNPAVKKPKTPESEQMSFLDQLKTASTVSKLASDLDNLNKKEASKKLKVVANKINEEALNSVKATHFFDEMTNKGISVKTALKVLDSFSSGADTEEDVSKATDIDKNEAKSVLDAAEKAGIIEVINSGKWDALKKIF